MIERNSVQKDLKKRRDYKTLLCIWEIKPMSLDNCQPMVVTMIYYNTHIFQNIMEQFLIRSSNQY